MRRAYGAGVRAERLQVGARLDALEALALQAALRFGDGLLRRVARSPGPAGSAGGALSTRFERSTIRPRREAAAVLARGRERDLLQLPIDGQGRPCGRRRWKRSATTGSPGRSMPPPAYTPGRLVSSVTGSTAIRPRSSTAQPRAAPASASPTPTASTTASTSGARVASALAPRGCARATVVKGTIFAPAAVTRGDVRRRARRPGAIALRAGGRARRRRPRPRTPRLSSPCGRARGQR